MFDPKTSENGVVQQEPEIQETSEFYKLLKDVRPSSFTNFIAIVVLIDKFLAETGDEMIFLSVLDETLKTHEKQTFNCMIKCTQAELHEGITCDMFDIVCFQRITVSYSKRFFGPSGYGQVNRHGLSFAVFAAENLDSNPKTTSRLFRPFDGCLTVVNRLRSWFGTARKSLLSIYLPLESLQRQSFTKMYNFTPTSYHNVRMLLVFSVHLPKEGHVLLRVFDGTKPLSRGITVSDNILAAALSQDDARLKLSKIQSDTFVDVFVYGPHLMSKAKDLSSSDVIEIINLHSFCRRSYNAAGQIKYVMHEGGQEYGRDVYALSPVSEAAIKLKEELRTTTEFQQIQHALV